MNANEQAPLWVGEFRIDRAAQQLWREGQPIDLVPQVWGLLLCLVERAGQLLTKDEILRAAWPEVAVSDMALSQAVRRLRTVFGDDARRPRYIETVHRRGFRLIAAIRAGPAVPMIARAPADEVALFVGRETELGRLAELLREARAGTRHVVFIEGEAGIGKSALLGSFLAEHAGEGVRIAAATCIEQHGSGEPYMPVLEALDRFARSHPDTLDVLRRYAPTWLVQMPWLLGRQGGTGSRDIDHRCDARPHAARDVARIGGHVGRATARAGARGSSLGRRGHDRPARVDREAERSRRGSWSSARTGRRRPSPMTIRSSRWPAPCGRTPLARASASIRSIAPRCGRISCAASPRPASRRRWPNGSTPQRGQSALSRGHRRPSRGGRLRRGAERRAGN